MDAPNERIAHYCKQEGFAMYEIPDLLYWLDDEEKADHDSIFIFHTLLM